MMAMYTGEGLSDVGNFFFTTTQTRAHWASMRVKNELTQNLLGGLLCAHFFFGSLIYAADLKLRTTSI
jgi:hypothetical protein